MVSILCILVETMLICSYSGKMGSRGSYPKGSGNGNYAVARTVSYFQDEAEKLDPMLIKGLFDHGVPILSFSSVADKLS